VVAHLKKFMLLGAAGLALLHLGTPSAVAAGTPGVTDTAITLGGSNALTGPVANACKPVTDGTIAWFAKVNAESGIKGRKVKFDLLDDAYDGTRAVANTRQLSREPVLAIISGCGTNSAVAIGPLANREGVPYIMPYAAHSDLVEPAKPWIFAGLPLYDKQLAALIGWVFKRSGPGTVATVAVQVPGIESWIAAAKKATEAGGGKFLEPQVSQSGQADFTPVVLRLKDEAPDYVIMAVAAGDGARLVETARVQQFAPKRSYLGYSTVANSIFLHSVTADVEGKIFVTSPTVPETSPEAEAACGTVFAKYAPDTELNGFSLWGCMVGQVTTAVLNGISGPMTREAMRDAFDKLDNAALTKLMPPITFTPKNHTAIRSLFIFDVKDGRYQVVDTAVIPK
jgi:branched-chain amino acid transport system substrate-binding protein